MTQRRIRFSDGFTLIEIMVVLFLISLVVLIVAPRLSFNKSSDIRESTRKIVQEIKKLQWEAISSQRLVRLNYNLDRGEISASMLAPSGDLIPFGKTGIRSFFLSKGVTMTQVRVLHRGKVHEGKTFTQFFSSGAIEPTTIFLRNLRGHRMAISIQPLTGRIRIIDGEYRERKPPPFYGPPSGEIPSLEDSDDEE